MAYYLFYCAFLSFIYSCLSATSSPDKSAIVTVSYHKGEYVVKEGHNNVKKEDSIVVAVGNFTNAQSTHGWLMLEISTDESFKDEIQATAAGIAEGYLTFNYIKEYYKDTYKRICQDNPASCDYFQNVLEENLQWQQDLIDGKRENDVYLHQLNLILKQMDGIKQGFDQRSIAIDDRDEDVMDIIQNHGVYKLNNIVEYYDFLEKFEMNQSASAVNFNEKKTPSCSVLIRIMPEKPELVFAHNTWHEYRAMGFKFLKRYNLFYHFNQNSDTLVPGYTITMSSYTATTSSLDDFYISSSGLGATETTLFIFNTDIYKSLTPKSVMEPIRVMIANRLASSTEEWSNYFSKFNSGTYNNQWMILDFNKFAENPRSSAGIFRVVEQLPGIIVSEDQTEKLQTDGYWGSYNRPFYPLIHEKSGNKAKQDEFGNWFSHGNNPRAKIMRRDAVNKVNDVESMMNFIWNNDYENEEFSKVDGCDGPTPAGSMSNRLDLSTENCTFSDLDWMVGAKWGYGGIDTKVASSAMSFPDLIFKTVAGPVHNDIYPPFSWSNTTVGDIPLFKPIDTFNFSPFDMIWSTEN